MTITQTAQGIFLMSKNMEKNWKPRSLYLCTWKQRPRASREPMKLEDDPYSINKKLLCCLPVSVQFTSVAVTQESIWCVLVRMAIVRPRLQAKLYWPSGFSGNLLTLHTMFYWPFPKERPSDYIWSLNTTNYDMFTLNHQLVGRQKLRNQPTYERTVKEKAL